MTTTIDERYAITLERIENEKKIGKTKMRKIKDDFAKRIIALLSTDYYKKQISDYLSEKGSLVLFFQEELYQNEVLNSDIQSLIDYYKSEGVFLDTKRVFLKNAYNNKNFCFLFFCTKSCLNARFNNNLDDFISHMNAIIMSENEGASVNVPHVFKLRNYFEGHLFPLLDLNVVLNKLPYEINSSSYKIVEYIDCMSIKDIEVENMLKTINKNYSFDDVSFDNIYLNFLWQVLLHFSKSTNSFYNDIYNNSKMLTSAKFLDEYINLMTIYKPIPESILTKFDEKLIKTGDIKRPHATWF